MTSTNPRERRSPARQTLLRYLRLFPGAIAVACATLAIAALTTGLGVDSPELTNKVGLTLHSLREGHLWLIPTSTLVQPELPVKWEMPAFVFIAVALLEYQVGTVRALVTFFLSDWISSPLMVLLVWGLSAAGWSEAKEVVGKGDAGASAAALGALVAAGLLLRRPWRDLVLWGTALFLVVQYFFTEPDAGIVHILGAMVGLGIGLVWLRWDQIRQIDTDQFWLTRLLTREWRTVLRRS